MPPECLFTSWPTPKPIAPRYSRGNRKLEVIEPRHVRAQNAAWYQSARLHGAHPRRGCAAPRSVRTSGVAAISVHQRAPGEAQEDVLEGRAANERTLRREPARVDGRECLVAVADVEKEAVGQLLDALCEVRHLLGMRAVPVQAEPKLEDIARRGLRDQPARRPAPEDLAAVPHD